MKFPTGGDTNYYNSVSPWSLHKAVAAVKNLTISQAKVVIRALQAAHTATPNGDPDEMIAAARAGV